MRLTAIGYGPNRLGHVLSTGLGVTSSVLGAVRASNQMIWNIRASTLAGGLVTTEVMHG
jgi:hypothetical protein